MVGILLAAGFSRRFGVADKLLQLLPDGRPLAVASAENLIKAIPNSVAVLRPENKMLANLVLSIGLKVVFCSQNDQEMADSLVKAIRFSTNLWPNNGGYVIALADMPYIRPDTIKAVSTKLSNGASIAIPCYQGQRGHPVAFSSRFRSDLESLQGDEGARSIIKRYSNEVELLHCDDPGILRDIDTLADLNN
jgi:molybdenum cofactor cytidylyltransferase